MIELIAAAVSGVVVGGGVVLALWRQDGDATAELWDKSRKAFWELETTLTALRSNCFIPDERGVKVRYSQASAQRRVKAETPKEVA